MHDENHGCHDHHHDELGLTEREKFQKRIEHWLHHNTEHEKAYLEWADKAREVGLNDVALLLEVIAEQGRVQNRLFEKIMNLL